MSEKPPIRPTPLNAFFWEAAKREVLLIQRCCDCRHYVHPPAPACPACGSFELSPQPVSGEGQVESFTIVRRAFHPAFANELPYVLARIELIEQADLILVTNVREAPVETVYVGQPVEVMFEHREDGSLPQFRPRAPDTASS